MMMMYMYILIHNTTQLLQTERIKFQPQGKQKPTIQTNYNLIIEITVQKKAIKMENDETT